MLVPLLAFGEWRKVPASSLPHEFLEQLEYASFLPVTSTKILVHLEKLPIENHFLVATVSDAGLVFSNAGGLRGRPDRIRLSRYSDGIVVVTPRASAVANDIVETWRSETGESKFHSMPGAGGSVIRAFAVDDVQSLQTVRELPRRGWHETKEWNLLEGRVGSSRMMSTSEPIREAYSIGNEWWFLEGLDNRFHKGEFVTQAGCELVVADVATGVVVRRCKGTADFLSGSGTWEPVGTAKTHLSSFEKNSVIATDTSVLPISAYDQTWVIYALFFEAFALAVILFVFAWNRHVPFLTLLIGFVPVGIAVIVAFLWYRWHPNEVSRNPFYLAGAAPVLFLLSLLAVRTRVLEILSLVLTFAVCLALGLQAIDGHPKFLYNVIGGRGPYRCEAIFNSRVTDVVKKQGQGLPVLQVRWWGGAEGCDTKAVARFVPLRDKIVAFLRVNGKDEVHFAPR